MLVTRLMESTDNAATRLDAYKFLHDARSVTFDWLKKLTAKLQKAEVESQVLDFQRRVCEMAALCRSTFDVNPVHLPKLLSDPENYAILVSCSVALYDNQPPDLGKSPCSLQASLCRDRRLAHKIVPLMLKQLDSKTKLLNGPVSDLWSSYRPCSSGWVVLPTPNSRWVSTTTAKTTEHSSQQVHLNLLEGQLLVGGNPLGRLPRDYVKHATYIRLFGQASYLTHLHTLILVLLLTLYGLCPHRKC
jgi:hypothetical protein